MLETAIIIVGNWPSEPNPGVPSRIENGRECTVPVACLEILGQSVVERLICRLQNAGIREINLLADKQTTKYFLSKLTSKFSELRIFDPRTNPHILPKLIEQQSRNGVEAVLVSKVCSHIEFDPDDFLNFHEAENANVTRACDDEGPLDLWIVNPRACFDFGSALHDMQDHSSSYFVTGYVNRLDSARALRRLVVDSFLGRCSIQPDGVEVEPGVWVHESASVHRRARIVAPAYIGAGVKIRSQALLTHFSNVERGCTVGQGSTVEDTSVLSYTRVGNGLRIQHAVVDGRRLEHLRHNIAVMVDEPNYLTRVMRSQWGLFPQPVFDGPIGFAREPMALDPLHAAVGVSSILDSAKVTETMARLKFSRAET